MASGLERSARWIGSGVVGCGAIANEHLAHLASDSRSKLLAVCDRSKAAAEFARDRFGAQASFTDLGEMLSVARPEIVHVLTPPQTHFEIVERCLDAGANVICEKPMTAAAEETEALLDYAASRGKWLVESRNLLFNDAILELTRLRDTGWFGRILEVDVLLSLDLAGGPFGDINLDGPGVALPGGAVHDFLPHLAYLFLHFAQVRHVDDVVGRLSNFSGNPKVGYDHIDALLRGGDSRGRIRISSDTKADMFRVIVRGSRASAETDLYSPYLRLEGAQNVGKRAPLEQLLSGARLFKSGIRNFRDKVVQHGTYHGLPRMLAAIYEAHLSGSPQPVTDEEIIATAHLVDRLLELREAR